MPKSYSINANNSHFNDTGLTGEYQKEVYLLSRDVLRKMAKLNNNNNKNNDNQNNNYNDNYEKNDDNNIGNKNRSVLTAIDVGCGSGWKLVKYISEEFRTIGIDTEPALSFLKKKYPNQVIYYRQPLGPN